MKDHVFEERRIDTPYKENLDDFLVRVEALAVGLVTPEVVADYGWDDSEWKVTGWRPMTEKEREQAKKRRAASRKANAARREKQREADLAELERLRKKYGEGTGA